MSKGRSPEASWPAKSRLLLRSVGGYGRLEGRAPSPLFCLLLTSLPVRPHVLSEQPQLRLASGHCIHSCLAAGKVTKLVESRAAVKGRAASKAAERRATAERRVIDRDMAASKAARDAVGKYKDYLTDWLHSFRIEAADKD